MSVALGVHASDCPYTVRCLEDAVSDKSEALRHYRGSWRIFHDWRKTCFAVYQTKIEEWEACAYDALARNSGPSQDWLQEAIRVGYFSQWMPQVLYLVWPEEDEIFFRSLTCVHDAEHIESILAFHKSRLEIDEKIHGEFRRVARAIDDGDYTATVSLALMKTNTLSVRI